MDENAKIYGVFDGEGKAKAFYASDVYPPEGSARNSKIPSDAVEVSQADWQILLEQQATARYKNGAIAYVEPPPTTAT